MRSQTKAILNQSGIGKVTPEKEKNYQIYLKRRYL